MLGNTLAVWQREAWQRPGVLRPSVLECVADSHDRAIPLRKHSLATLRPAIACGWGRQSIEREDYAATPCLKCARSGDQKPCD